MNIIWHEKTRQIHLCNQYISYIMYVQPNGELGQLYYGSRVRDKEDFTYLSFRGQKSHVCGDFDNENFSMELNRQEYSSLGGTDFGTCGYEMMYSDGSRFGNYKYAGHTIIKGKKALAGLPATYASQEEAMTIEVTMKDEVRNVLLILSYTIFNDYPAIARSVRFVNESSEKVILKRALSMCLDLEKDDYEMMQFSGAWSRERIPAVRKIDTGITAIESRRGVSSANQNSFVILKKVNTDEFAGEAIGFSLLYSGNFLAQFDADTYGRLRFVMGINPANFEWPLEKGEEFTTPEAVFVYTNKGLNDLSRSIHHLYNNNLVRGKWKNRTRPILLNNWEATFMSFTQEDILRIASKAKEAGAELFVLDDGWFGARNDDHAGLGDWKPNLRKLPGGIKGLAQKVNELGLEFGFWIEPEMVNPDSDLYREHPDWVLSIPGRKPSLSRHQLVLDYSRSEVVDYIYKMLYEVIDDANIAYIKWDMNRSIAEFFSQGTDSDKQGMVFHKYVLGVYDLYERLRTAFPDILFESCASGGARFDAGMLYYAPQAWCSDNTDAADRLLIQTGSSYGYPLSAIGSHVSAVPNQQTGRTTSIDFRANVAYFGTFGYELDLNHVTDEELEKTKKQIEFMKENRQLIQFGDFYRLITPFNNDLCAWMVVSPDKNEAIVGCYVLKARVNSVDVCLKLTGLDESKEYTIGSKKYYGDELQKIGLMLNAENAPGFFAGMDYSSVIIKIEA